MRVVGGRGHRWWSRSPSSKEGRMDSISGVGFSIMGFVKVVFVIFGLVGVGVLGVMIAHRRSQLKGN